MVARHGLAINFKYHVASTEPGRRRDAAIRDGRRRDLSAGAALRELHSELRARLLLVHH